MIVTATHRWACPNCPVTTISHDNGIAYHRCAGLHGLTAPLVPAGSKAEVRLVEREDYIGSEQGVRLVNGRPVMSLVTNRADGSNDAVVFAPTATLKAT